MSSIAPVSPAPSAGAAAPLARPDLQVALAEALAIADAAPDVRDAARRLRERFAPCRVVVVEASDMRDETPAGTGAKAQLHYAASDGHCWSVSRDGASAAGYFLSWKD